MQRAHDTLPILQDCMRSCHARQHKIIGDSHLMVQCLEIIDTGDMNHVSGELVELTISHGLRGMSLLER